MRLIGNDKIWEKEGINEFSGTAEFSFVPNTEGGVSYSNGNRLRFKGSIDKKGQTYSLNSPLTIEDDVNTNNLKKYKWVKLIIVLIKNCNPFYRLANCELVCSETCPIEEIKTICGKMMFKG